MNYKHLAAALLFAGALSGAATAALSPTVFTKPGPIAVKPDDDFLIAAPSNPGTGYAWTATSSDKKVVSLDGSAYRAPANAMPGAGGEQIFSFEAQRAGHATITLAYARAWEKNVKPARLLVFTVSVAK